GQPIEVRVAAAATNGVAVIELRANDPAGSPLASQDNPSLSHTLSGRLIFTPTQIGRIVLLATAQDATGIQSSPASVTVIVVERVSWLATPTAPSDLSTSHDNRCRPDAEFVADITIPDNTIIERRTPFVKTWRLRNSGSCAWEGNYTLIFLRGEQMNAVDRVPVANTAPGATVDLSVTFVAPDKPGVYTSTWQLRGPQGALFGKPIFTVIQVP
ncbi:MAG: NBR1-Ig-like domain-containing protein, partial [Anaerolineae bacterium]|nr:NBR1-Ig-like domain-containing protein [Thermoflexales bacterium]MDW8406976.1 NBR1-Ig-like domain-containing protein [Anaerolineae bacterium]